MSRNKALPIPIASPIIRLYPISDTHVGALASNHSHLVSLANIIADDPHAYVIGIGDYIEAISPDDWRFDPSELSTLWNDLAPSLASTDTPLPDYINNIFYHQALYFAHLFQPTRGKWLGLINGNHESTCVRKHHFSPTSIIAHHLSAPHVGGTDESGWLRLLLRSNNRTRHTINIYLQHGWGGGELRGSDALKLQRLLWRKSADILILGHVHRPTAFPETIEYVDRHNNVSTKQRWGIITYPIISKHGYLARRGGNAPPSGYVVIQIERRNNSTPLISVELNPFS